MSASHALSHPMRGVRRSVLALFALAFAVTITLLSGSAAHAEVEVPDKPEDLIYATEGAEVSAPDMESITSLMNGLNDAHDEKVGVIITDDDVAAGDLAKEALKEWGLSEDGAIIVITTKGPVAAVAVAENVQDRVSAEDQKDVVAKVNDGIGEHADWANGIHTGATRLFLYIEDQGLSGGTDGHHEEDGHTHEADDPAVEEVPVGEAPDDAYTGESGASEEEGLSNPAKITTGIIITFLAGAGLFLLYRNGRKKVAAKNDEDGPEEHSDASKE